MKWRWHWVYGVLLERKQYREKVGAAQILINLYSDSCQHLPSSSVRSKSVGGLEHTIPTPAM